MDSTQTIRAARRPRLCALVSTAGGLLSRKHGSAIDAASIVARVGQSPVGGRFEQHVGTRTSVRFVSTSFFNTHNTRMNTKHMHKIIEEMACSNSDTQIVFMVRRSDLHMQNATEGPGEIVCPRAIVNFMARHSRMTVRCMSATLRCRWPLKTLPTGGFVALGLLLERFDCDTVRLFGFENDNHSLPYHYWSEGSAHDGVSTGDWYSRRSMWHNFELEHALIRDVVGRCSWNATAGRYQEACDRRFEGADEELRKCEAYGPKSAAMRTNARKRATTLISELHAERQARRNCTDAGDFWIATNKTVPWTGAPGAKRCGPLTARL